MKYLKTYTIFESDEPWIRHMSIRDERLEETKQYCKDILLELDDIGFETSVIVQTKCMPSEINIAIRNRNEFAYKDISDVAYSLDEYLKTQGFLVGEYIKTQISKG